MGMRLQQQGLKWVMTGLLLIVSSLSYAKDLSETRIQHWLDSVIPMQTWAMQNKDAFNKANKNKAPDMSPEGMIQSLKDAGLYNKASSKVKAFGFKSADDWIFTQHQVIQAMMALQIDNQPHKSFDAAKQIEQVKNNPQIPPAQKTQMLKIIESTAKMFEKAKSVSANDKAAVKPHMQEIMMKMSQAKAGEK